MNYYKINLIIFVLFVNFLHSQEVLKDTTKVNSLEEVIVIGSESLSKNTVRPLAPLDAFLEESNKVTAIKRGNYAWEPTINNMLSERISVTIDGMQIFGACTDKMDPITSYVDVSNLSEATVKSGQQGTENGAAIGGGIDLKLQKGNFESKQFDVGVDVGYETNGNVRIVSSEVNYSDSKFFINADGIFRKADNYFAGGDEEVYFSQYQKYNISTTAGFKVSENGAIIGSFIYDKATDVGYPALTMDVSSAEAIIGSVSYEHTFQERDFKSWETKFYLNTITHVMDDTKRPDVPVHMDMPGWSDTYGFYSKLSMEKSKHSLLFNLNGYYNKSLAEMTMYPNDSDENIMFMLTWPDVRTFYTGIYGEDEFAVSENSSLKLNARFGYQHEYIADSFGLKSLQIFYPEMSDTQSRGIFSIATQYQNNFQDFQFIGGLAFGQRAPSVTEAYGFYLYNSYDNYDYIGNPYLTNENSLELNASLNYTKNKFFIGFEGSAFHISNYIIGEIEPNFDRMTIGAYGVKVYKALDYAIILDTSLSSEYKISTNFTLKGSIGYSLGQDNEGENLPLISPFSYKTAISYKQAMFDTELGLYGASKQQNYSADYGEDMTDSYNVYYLNASYNFYAGSNNIYVKAGVDNIFDMNYSTYADWNNIPRPGRNFFINVSYKFK